MEWARLGLDIAFRLGAIIVEALARGDDAVLDAKVGDLLGGELRNAIAKRAADARAAEKFGGA